MTDLSQLQSSPAAFRSHLQIDTDAGPARFADAMDDWQQQDFAALDAGWQVAAGQQPSDGATVKLRGWLERPRGHSKTSDIAVMAAWCLFASRKPLRGYAVAADRDQSGLLRDAISRLIHANPWLRQFLQIQAWRVRNPITESEMEILTSDVGSSFGLLPDFVILDEVVHWPESEQGSGLFHSLLSSAAKRSSCMLVSITNAGFMHTWQADLRDAVRTDPDWYFSQLDRPCASWITDKILAEQARLLPRNAYQRLWENVWSDSGGDALGREVIDHAFRDDLQPLSRSERGLDFVCGVDLGVSRDASAIVVLGVRRAYQGHGRIRLAQTRIWKPSAGRKIDLSEVESELVKLHLRFQFRSVSFDPWQATGMMQRLQAGGFGKVDKLRFDSYGSRSKRPRLPVVEVPQTGSTLVRQASTLIQVFNDYNIELFDDPDLRRDLYRLRCEEKSYGLRLVSPRDEHGHGDMVSAFSIALVSASELAGRRVQRIGALDFDSPTDDDQPLSFAERQFQRNKREFERLQEEFLAERADPQRDSLKSHLQKRRHRDDLARSAVNTHLFGKE